MIRISANGNKSAYGVKHYILDTLEDLLSLNPSRLEMGTTAFIIDSSKYYMVNGSGVWKQINPHTSSGGGGTTPDVDDEVIYEGGGVESDSVDDEAIYEGGGVDGEDGDENIYEGGKA